MMLLCRYSQLDPGELSRLERRLGFECLDPRCAKVLFLTLHLPPLSSPVPHIVQLWLVLQVSPVSCTEDHLWLRR